MQISSEVQNKKECMKNSKLWHLLDNEYGRYIQRKNDLQDRAVQLFAYNISIFGFVFLFFDYNQFFKFIHFCLKDNRFYIRLIIVTVFSTLLFIGLIICAISLYKFYSTFHTNEIYFLNYNDFNEKYMEGKEIVRDYKKIFQDYDGLCIDIAERLDIGFFLMMMGIIFVIIPLLAITVCIHM